ncbi:MAG: FliM/FliN family flagellar motor switch protein [Phycisphaerales bacterium]|nr:FliM/FliN family flagellar motor switch protein [Phycisphaerales bacterium]
MDPNALDAMLTKVRSGADEVRANAAVAPAEALSAIDQAAASIAEIAGEMAPPPPPAKRAVARPAPSAAASTTEPALPLSSEVTRLLAIEVPVIVQLGMRRLTVGEVMRLAVGAIIEFGKSAEEELDLLANNKAIGKGHAVKVGENFGIKVTSISSVRETIKKLGT